MPLRQGFAIGQLTVLELTGKDRNKILNNLCTQDLRTLESGQVRETFVLDVKGRTLAHGTVAALEDRSWFISVPDLGEILVPHIDRYIIREDAVVRDASEEWNGFLFAPSEQNDPALPWSVTSDSDCSSLTDSSGIAVRTPWLGQGTTLVLPHHGEKSTIIDDLAGCTIPSNCKTRAGWEAHRIRAFWPWYGVDIDSKNLPQEISIDARAISFKKGCYLGQETVARLDALGQVQKRLVAVQFEADPGWSFNDKTEILNGDQSIGSITSAAPLSSSPNGPNEWIGLAFLKRGVGNIEQGLNPPFRRIQLGNK